MPEGEHNLSLLTDEVRELVALMRDSDVAEVLIERGDAKLHIKRAIQPPAPAVVPVYNAPQPVVAAVAATPQAASPVAAIVEPIAEAAEPAGVVVSAPMVGTFYGSPSPKEPPYVQVGDEVKPGDVLGIIEAMKIMNEIECEVHGRVAQIQVQNGQSVEYGQPLMLIEPL
jgi:acetyl-CoA carboxylase biotin carboxyl carrier protein